MYENWENDDSAIYSRELTEDEAKELAELHALMDAAGIEHD